MNDRAVSGEFEAQRLVGGALNLRGLLEPRHALPPIFVAIEVRIVWRGLVDIQVLFVGTEEEGEAESDCPVVAHHDAGARSLTGADAIKFRATHMNDVAKR